MSEFKTGEWVNTDGLSDDVINALKVRGFDCWLLPMDAITAPYTALFRGERQDGTLRINFNFRDEITLEDALFRGAPEEAIYVVEFIDGGFYWSDGLNFCGFKDRGWCRDLTVLTVRDPRIVYKLKTEETLKEIKEALEKVGVHASTSSNYFEELKSEEESMNKKDWYENGEYPPVGEVVQTSVGMATVMTVSDLSDQVCVGYPCGSLSLLPIDAIKPIQTVKKIDMSKFSGSNFLLRDQDSGEVTVIDFRIFCFLNHEPAYYHWNFWQGDSEPEFLEGFEYEVQYLSGFDCKLKVLDHTNSIHWPSVVAIKITGIKEGYELRRGNN